MSRHDASRLADVVEAIEAIKDHLTRGSLDDGLVYDALRVRLIEIGEAVKGISPDLLDTEPDVPWKAIARMRDHLAHIATSTPTTRSCKTWWPTSSSHS